MWHLHPDPDELFHILSGTLTIEIEGEKGREDVMLGQGELFVVPRGVQHRPIMLIERAGVVNTEDVGVSDSTREVEDARPEE